jgi:hypothetical protein
MGTLQLKWSNIDATCGISRSVADGEIIKRRCIPHTINVCPTVRYQNLRQSSHFETNQCCYYYPYREDDIGRYSHQLFDAIDDSISDTRTTEAKLWGCVRDDIESIGWVRRTIECNIDILSSVRRATSTLSVMVC